MCDAIEAQKSTILVLGVHLVAWAASCGAYWGYREVRDRFGGERKKLSVGGGYGEEGKRTADVMSSTRASALNSSVVGVAEPVQTADEAHRRSVEFSGGLGTEGGLTVDNMLLRFADRSSDLAVGHPYMKTPR